LLHWRVLELMYPQTKKIPLIKIGRAETASGPRAGRQNNRLSRDYIGKASRFLLIISPHIGMDVSLVIAKTSRELTLVLGGKLAPVLIQLTGHVAVHGIPS